MKNMTLKIRFYEKRALNVFTLDPSSRKDSFSWPFRNSIIWKISRRLVSLYVVNTIGSLGVQRINIISQNHAQWNCENDTSKIKMMHCFIINYALTHYIVSVVMSLPLEYCQQQSLEDFIEISYFVLFWEEIIKW